MDVGVWLGVIEWTEESIIATEKGIVKCRIVNRLPENQTSWGKVLSGIPSLKSEKFVLALTHTIAIKKPEHNLVSLARRQSGELYSVSTTTGNTTRVFSMSGNAQGGHTEEVATVDWVPSGHGAILCRRVTGRILTRPMETTTTTTTTTSNTTTITITATTTTTTHARRASIWMHVRHATTFTTTITITAHTIQGLKVKACEITFIVHHALQQHDHMCTLHWFKCNMHWLKSLCSRSDN